MDRCLARRSEAFRDLEEHAARLAHELNEARLEITRLAANEQKSIDAAMLAVFDAKDRIIQAAHERAQAIEDQARRAAGLPVAAPPPAPPIEVPVADPEEDVLTELSELVGEAPSEGVQPNEVLEQMLHEAEVIRNRLDSGLAAAFDQMEQMQRDAEVRAREMLTAARDEASRLRRAGLESGDTSIEVRLTEDDRRPSRYSKNSAGLPRIGGEDGASVLSKMNSLREKFREEEQKTGEQSGVAGNV